MFSLRSFWVDTRLPPERLTKERTSLVDAIRLPHGFYPQVAASQDRHPGRPIPFSYVLFWLKCLTSQLSTASSGKLLPGDSFTFNLQVMVPVDAQVGERDTTQVMVESGHDDTVQALAHVTTTAYLSYSKLYLPLIKNH